MVHFFNSAHQNYANTMEFANTGRSLEAVWEQSGSSLDAPLTRYWSNLHEFLPKKGHLLLHSLITR